jgi:hypothetical protein
MIRRFHPSSQPTEQRQEEVHQAQAEKEQQTEVSSRNQQSNQNQVGPVNQPRQDSRRVNQSESRIAVLLLTPAVRSGGTPDLVTVSSGTTTVSLVISRPLKERVTNYRVVLQTTDGNSIESRSNLQSRRSPSSQTITLQFSVNQLRGDSFKLTLVGKAADSFEFAEDFYFNVIRK